MKWFFSTILIFIANLVFAAGSLPYECQPLPVDSATVVLENKPPYLVAIQNTSDVDLWITHPITEPGASAGWSTRLQSKHWTALALGVKTFELSCIESKPGHEQQVPCSGVIKICKWDGISSTEKTMGSSYWAAENKSLSELLAELGQRGFKLPRPPKS